MLRGAEAVVRVGVALCLAFLLSSLAQAQPKPASDLLLPYFEVGLTDGDVTTLLAVSNDLNRQVDVLAAVNTNWGVQVLTVPLKLKPHELWTADLRDWFLRGKLPGNVRLTASELLHLQAALSGQPSPQNGLYYSTATAADLAVGSITIRTLGDRPAALRGQSFRVDPSQGSSAGEPLANVSPSAKPAESCNRHTVRHLSGTGLGGSQVILWTDTGGQALPAPTAEDRRLPVRVAVFSAAGALVKNQTVRLLPADKTTVAKLGLTQPLGRLELATDKSSVVATEPGGDAAFATSCTQTPPNTGPRIQIATLVNGQDANAAPGPKIAVGAPVVWSYKVSNTGAGTLTKVAVTDDQAGTVHCPLTSLKPGQAMTCTRRGTAAGCQHKNVGTATGSAGKLGTVISQDAASYYGDDGAAVEIAVATNGDDANTGTGPQVPAGSPVQWTYLVTNTGTIRIFQIAVNDSRGVAVSCPRVSLAPGEPMTCKASGTAVPGQYSNTGTVTATGTCGTVTASDPSHYFGQSDTGLQLRALTNGYDADFPPGPSIAVGSPVTWEYAVSNSGQLAVTGISVADNQGAAVSCPDTVLQPGSAMNCIARGVAQACQHSNYGTVTGRTSLGLVSASNPSNYFGQSQAALQIMTATNGVDADQAPGPTVATGSPVQWTYTVTNLGQVVLTGVAVSDDKGAVVTCPQSTLRLGESMTCTATGTAVSGDYLNLGTVTANPPCGAPVTASNPSHYHGAGDPGVKIQTLVNGQDANLPPGPSIPLGSTVTWSYVVTNTGQLGLTNIAVSDSRGVTVTCPKTSLPAGQSMTCTGQGVAQACQYDNLGKVTAQTPAGALITAVDPSYYLGGANPAVQVRTATNGADANDPPGPTIRVGSPVHWTYTVTNTGDVPLANIVVSDDQGAAVSCPATVLQPNESMTCSASGTAMEGQFSNAGTASGAPPCGGRVTAQDPSHYFGGGDGGLKLQKLTNGQDANDPPGPTIPLGQPVTWSYVVTNIGTVALSAVGVTDNRGVSVICPQTTLNAGQSMTCTGTGTAQACQYTNLGIATGKTAGGQQITAVDPSNYFGQIQPAVRIETSVNGQSADNPPGPALAVGSAVTWTYTVTNTGNAALANVRVTDNPGAAVTCPGSSLQPGQQMTCSAAGIAVEGLFHNVGTVTADPPCGAQVTAQNPANYTGGGGASLQLQKLVNGNATPQAPGPSIPVGQAVLWSYVVTNTGQVAVSGIRVGDDRGVVVSCLQTTLQPGAAMTCTGRGTAEACQYNNTGTVTGQTPGGQQVTATDTSYYFGQANPSVQIETATNGFAADQAPGPTIAPGTPVTWTYTVVNTGNIVLTNILVTDSQGPAVICTQTTLQPGASMVCSASGTATEGQYSNTGTATATPLCGAQVTAQNPSHYLGAGNAALALQKLVNGQAINTPPGLSIPLGQPVTWTYKVTNAGQVALSGVGVTDNRGVTVTCPKSALQPGEIMSCTGTGTAQACQYDNLGIATGKTAAGVQVAGVDQSYYFGQIQPAVAIETSVNGQTADSRPGPTIPVGAQVTWSYTVTNTGNAALANVRVGDDKTTGVSCPKTSLQPGEVMICYALGTAVEGQYDNVGSATADPPCGAAVTAQNASHYLGGGTPAIQLQKLVNGQDAQWPGPSIQVGQPVLWSYVVTDSGLVTLSSVQVTDDRGVAVSCPATTLQPGASMTCTGRSNAQACQYLNLGKATAQSAAGQTVSAVDPSYYNGQFQTSIQIQTSINGNDADTPPGAQVPVGSPVRWTYTVSNPGDVTLSNVTVHDTQGAVVSCPSTTLGARQSMTCTSTGSTLAAAGQSGTVGSVTADPPCGARVSAQDPAYYFGVIIGVTLTKYTNGQHVAARPGPTLVPGSAVAWTYVVTNLGNLAVDGLSVTDDKGVAVSCPKSTLQPNEAVTCTGSGTAQSCQYDNTGTVTGSASGTPVQASDQSHYFGQSASGISLTMTVNGTAAGQSPGVPLLFNQAVVWGFTVTNTGAGTLTNVAVTNDQSLPVTCPQTSLATGASMTCQVSSAIKAAQDLHQLAGTVTANDSCGSLSATGTANYNVPVLEFDWTQQFTPLWDDQGSGADRDGGFWRPLPRVGTGNPFFIIGDYGRGDYGNPNGSASVVTLRVKAYDNPQNPVLVPPGNFTKVWDDSGSGANDDGSVWAPVPPSATYICSGHVFQHGHSKPVPSDPNGSPGLANYRCLRSDLAVQVNLGGLIWDDKGSGADDDVSVYRIDKPNILFAVGNYTRPPGQTTYIPIGLP